MIRPSELIFDQHTAAVASAASKRTAVASRQLSPCTGSGTPPSNGGSFLRASCYSAADTGRPGFHEVSASNKMLWPGSIKPITSS